MKIFWNYVHNMLIEQKAETNLGKTFQNLGCNGKMFSSQALCCNEIHEEFPFYMPTFPNQKIFHAFTFKYSLIQIWKLSSLFEMFKWHVQWIYNLIHKWIWTPDATTLCSFLQVLYNLNYDEPYEH